MRLETLGTLVDIREAAPFIVDATVDVSFEAFLADRMRRDAVERNFITIGEAVNRLRRHDPETLGRLSRISEIVGMRNILIHRNEEIAIRMVSMRRLLVMDARQEQAGPARASWGACAQS